jgi:hypothetical protein
MTKKIIGLSVVLTLFCLAPNFVPVASARDQVSDGAFLNTPFAIHAAAQTSTNVAPNPSFEQGGCGNTPLLCGWTSTDPNASMSQDTINPHTRSASMSVECASPACDLYAGGAAYASTDPAFCAHIGPGAHAASFWYRDAAATEVALGAAFYPTPDCTGLSSSASLSVMPVGGGRQQVTGALAAPPGTQSALFSLGVIGGCIGACEDPGPCHCGIEAKVDDVVDEGLGDTTPPSISSFSPTSGQEDAWVSITGTNFTGATSVTVNGTATPDLYVNSSTDILAVVWDGSRSRPISVTTPFGTATGSGSFTVTASPPVICCFSPASGPVGTGVDLVGTNFTGATSVTFNGTAEPSFVVARRSNSRWRWPAPRTRTAPTGSSLRTITRSLTRRGRRESQRVFATITVMPSARRQ